MHHEAAVDTAVVRRLHGGTLSVLFRGLNGIVFNEIKWLSSRMESLKLLPCVLSLIPITASSRNLWENSLQIGILASARRPHAQFDVTKWENFHTWIFNATLKFDT